MTVYKDPNKATIRGHYFDEITTKPSPETPDETSPQKDAYRPPQDQPRSTPKLDLGGPHDQNATLPPGSGWGGATQQQLPYQANAIFSASPNQHQRPGEEREEKGALGANSASPKRDTFLVFAISHLITTTLYVISLIAVVSLLTGCIEPPSINDEQEPEPITEEEIAAFYSADENRFGVQHPFLIEVAEEQIVSVSESSLMILHIPRSKIPVSGSTLFFPGGKEKELERSFIRKVESVRIDFFEGLRVLVIETSPGRIEDLLVSGKVGQPFLLEPVRLADVPGDEGFRHQFLGDSTMKTGFMRRVTDPLKKKLQNLRHGEATGVFRDGIEIKFEGIIEPSEDAFDVGFIEDDPLQISRGELVEDRGVYHFTSRGSDLARLGSCREMPARLARANSTDPDCFEKYWIALGESVLGVERSFPSTPRYDFSRDQFLCPGAILPGAAEIEAYSRGCSPSWEGDLSVTLSGMYARMKFDRFGFGVSLHQTYGIVSEGANASEIVITPELQFSVPFGIPLGPVLILPARGGVKLTPLALRPGELEEGGGGALASLGVGLDTYVEDLELAIETRPLTVTYDAEAGAFHSNSDHEDEDLFDASVTHDPLVLKGSVEGLFEVYALKVEPYVNVAELIEASLYAALVTRIEGALGVTRREGEHEIGGKLCVSSGLGVEAEFSLDLPFDPNDDLTASLGLYNACNHDESPLCIFEKCLGEEEVEPPARPPKTAKPLSAEAGQAIKITAQWADDDDADFDLAISRVSPDGSTEVLCRYGTNCHGAKITRRRSNGEGCLGGVCKETLHLANSLDSGLYRITLREYGANTDEPARHPLIKIDTPLVCISPTLVAHDDRSFHFDLDLTPRASIIENDDGSITYRFVSDIYGKGYKSFPIDKLAHHDYEVHLRPARGCDLDLYSDYRGAPTREAGNHQFSSHAFGEVTESLTFYARKEGPYWVSVYNFTSTLCGFELFITETPADPFSTSTPPAVDGFDWPVNGGSATPARDGDGFHMSQGFTDDNPAIAKGHCGDDWVSESAPSNGVDSIHAVAHGIVTYAGLSPRPDGIGHVIIIQHFIPGHPEYERIESVYWHAWSIEPHVREGVVVRRGEVIGTIGDGTTPGRPELTAYLPHLHFEIRHFVGQPADYERGYGCFDESNGMLDPSLFINTHRIWPLPLQGPPTTGNRGSSW